MRQSEFIENSLQQAEISSIDRSVCNFLSLFFISCKPRLFSMKNTITLKTDNIGGEQFVSDAK